MAQFRTGDMLADWNRNQPDLLLITTNATLNERGALVMGAGIAKQVRDRFAGLDVVLGQQVQARSNAFTPFEHKGRRYRVYSPRYDLLVSPAWPEKRLGLFQVKTRFCNDASLNQIQESAAALLLWCAEHPEAEIWLNFPGIGNGRLSRNEVLPIVRQLSHNVVVWELGK